MEVTEDSQDPRLIDCPQVLIAVEMARLEICPVFEARSRTGSVSGHESHNVES